MLRPSLSPRNKSKNASEYVKSLNRALSFKFNHYEKTPISPKSNLLTSNPISAISSRIFNEKEKAFMESLESKYSTDAGASPLKSTINTGENFRVTFNEQQKRHSRKSSIVGLGKIVSMRKSARLSKRQSMIMLPSYSTDDPVVLKKYEDFLSHRKLFQENLFQKINSTRKMSMNKLSLSAKKQENERLDKAVISRKLILDINGKLDLPQLQKKRLFVDAAITQNCENRNQHSRTIQEENFKSIISSAYFRKIDDKYFASL